VREMLKTVKEKSSAEINKYLENYNREIAENAFTKVL